MAWGSKGQLISKCPFGVFKSTKKATNFCIFKKEVKSKKIRQKNSSKKSSRKIPKFFPNNPENLQRISQKIPKIQKISNSLLRGRKPFRACFHSKILIFTFFSFWHRSPVTFWGQTMTSLRFPILAEWLMKA